MRGDSLFSLLSSPRGFYEHSRDQPHQSESDRRSLANLVLTEYMIRNSRTVKGASNHTDPLCDLRACARHELDGAAEPSKEMATCTAGTQNEGLKQQTHTKRFNSAWFLDILDGFIP